MKIDNKREIIVPVAYYLNKDNEIILDSGGMLEMFSQKLTTMQDSLWRNEGYSKMKRRFRQDEVMRQKTRQVKERWNATRRTIDTKRTKDE